MRNNYRIRTYYSLEDITALLVGREINSPFNAPELNDVYRALGNPSTIAANIITDPKVKELWKNYIWPQFEDWSTVYDDCDLTTEEMRPIIVKWFALFLSKLNSTYTYYKPLIDEYEKNEATLLNGVKVSTTQTSNVNDTPTNIGNYEGKEFNTSVSSVTNTTTSDITTIEDRLANIREKWTNMFNTWTEEFSGLFIYE